jgi:hypothetical protein
MKNNNLQRKEWILMFDHIYYKPGLIECTIPKWTVIIDVKREKDENNFIGHFKTFSFRLKSNGQKFTTHYEWQFTENTKRNRRLLKLYYKLDKKIERLKNLKKRTCDLLARANRKL